MSFTTDAARWRALTTRDPSANGQFVYSVKSTNCYCRPTCPARLARRANVGFFQTAADARAAGFRACKRCKPDDEMVKDPQEAAVAKACSIIQESIKEDNPKYLRLQDLAKKVGLTPRYLHKIFKDRTGMSPKVYATSRMEKGTTTTSTTSSSSKSPIDPEAFNIDFDLEELMDFDTNYSLAPSSTIPMHDQDDMMYKFNCDFNIQTQSLAGYATQSRHGIADSRTVEPTAMADKTGIDLAFEKLSALSTFECDANLVLGADSLCAVLTDDEALGEATLRIGSQ